MVLSCATADSPVTASIQFIPPRHSRWLFDKSCRLDSGTTGYLKSSGSAVGMSNARVNDNHERVLNLYVRDSMKDSVELECNKGVNSDL